MQTYTIKTIAQETYELSNANSNEQLIIDTNHPKWRVVNKAATANELRVINVSDTGRWNSSKDYKNVYGTATASNTTKKQIAKPVEINLEKLDDLNIDDSLFEAMETGTIFDKFCSSEGGIQKGTNIMTVGAPGIGKCVRHNSMIKVKNKTTGEILELTIKEFHEMI